MIGNIIYFSKKNSKQSSLGMQEKFSILKFNDNLLFPIRKKYKCMESALHYEGKVILKRNEVVIRILLTFLKNSVVLFLVRKIFV